MHFFKTFILPHFDYCSSLFVYFSGKLLNNLCKLYNFCIIILLKLDLKFLSYEAQQKLLKPLNLMPLKFRFFFRFSLLSHKILNKQILLNISDLLQPITKLAHTRDKSSNLYLIPIKCSVKGAKRISIVLATMVNKVLRNSTNLSLKDFLHFIFSNSDDLFYKFSKFILYN